MIRSDVHMHSSYSADSDTSMEMMIKGSIQKELEFICFTDHQDKNCFLDDMEYTFDTGKYREDITWLKEKYKDSIEICFGTEMGLMPEEPEFCQQYPKQWDFDFVIGSVHFIDYKDPYYPVFFDDYPSDYDAYRHFLEVTLENVKNYDDFDTLGHLDYVIRYGKEREKAYLEHEFYEITDEILRILISRGQGLEVNSAGLKYGLPFAHPHERVLKRYRELGGEILTIGSDAHRPEHIAYDFPIVERQLGDIGFRYYTRYRNRKPEFIKIE